MSPRRSGKRRRHSSNSQAKFIIFRWNLMPKKLKKIKNLSPLTLNGHSSMMPCVTSTNRESTSLIRKNSLPIKESKKGKLKSENSSPKPKSTKPMAKISSASFNKKSNTSKKTDSQFSPKRTTKFKESLRKTKTITTGSKKSKPKTASFHTNWTSPVQPFPSWTWRRKKANKRSRASTRCTMLNCNNWKRKKPTTSSSRRGWLTTFGKLKDKYVRQCNTLWRIY